MPIQGMDVQETGTGGNALGHCCLARQLLEQILDEGRNIPGTLHELRLGSAEMMALPDGVKGVNHTAGAAAVRPECNITSSRRAVFSSRKANSIRASATLSKQG